MIRLHAIAIRNELYATQMKYLSLVFEAHKQSSRILKEKIMGLKAIRDAEEREARLCLPRSFQEYTRLESIDKQGALEVAKYLRGDPSTKITLFLKYSKEKGWTKEDAGELTQEYASSVRLWILLRSLSFSMSSFITARVSDESRCTRSSKIKHCRPKTKIYICR